MGELALWIAIGIASTGVLIWGSDAFISAAERFGVALRLPGFILGVTVIAIGTSLPELVSSVVAVARGVPELPVATAIGSNVTNILLILAAAAIFGRGLQVDYELVRVDLPFLFGSSLLLLLFAFDGEIGWIEGLLSLAGLAVYLIYASGTQHPAPERVSLARTDQEPAGLPARAWGTLALGLVFLQVGAYLVVESVVRISALIGVGVEIISASAVAVGTSLPELVVSVRSALAGKPELAVGNVIGSNVFNAFGVVGLPALLGTLAVPGPIVVFALPCMLGATVLSVFVLQEREMTHWDGWLFLILYAGFTAQLYGAL